MRIIKGPTRYTITDVYRVPNRIHQLLGTNSVACGSYIKNDIGYHYDESKRELRIPGGFPAEQLELAFDCHNFETEQAPRYDTIKADLVSPPKDWIQEDVLAFACGQGKFKNTLGESQLYIDLDTGKGKTYIGVALTCYYKSKVVIIIPPNTKVCEQWLDSYSKFTSLRHTDIVHLQGSEMCSDVIEGKYNDAKVFIVMTSTILSFVKKYENRWDMVDLLFDAMHVNMKIIDEAHLNLETILKIDMHSNVAKTYYMSSSPSRSDISEKKIYARVFKDVMRYGKKLVTTEMKHIIPVIMQFHSQPSPEWSKRVHTMHGTSLPLYGEYLLAPDGARDDFLEAYAFSLYYLLRFRRAGGKILVLCPTIKFAEDLKSYTNSIIPYMSTGLFVGSGKNKDDELENDIVFSTTSSMGTGAEFQNHQMTINTLTYSSSVLADQLPGRIREQSNRKGIYLEIVNMAHKTAKKHFQSREPYLANKAKDGVLYKHEISEDDIIHALNFFNSKYRLNKDGMLTDEDGYIIMQRRMR